MATLTHRVPDDPNVAAPVESYDLGYWDADLFIKEMGTQKELIRVFLGALLEDNEVIGPSREKYLEGFQARWSEYEAETEQTTPEGVSSVARTKHGDRSPGEGDDDFGQRGESDSQ